MRLKTFLLAMLATMVAHAAQIDVTPATFAEAYANAAAGDVLLLGEGAYGGQLTFPSGKTITMKAADGAEVTFACTFRANDAALSDGGIILEGLKVAQDDSYFINLDNYGDIKTITIRGCEVSGIGRCFLRTNSTGHNIDEIVFDNCLIHDCGTGGWNFMYPKHVVKRVSVSNSTLYNYQNGESLFMPNASDANNVFTFEFSSNTVYRWGKSNDRALCKTEGKYSAASAYIFTDNIVYKGGADNVKPQMIQATGGTLMATNNLVVDYDGYNMGGDAVKDINDLALEGLGMTELSFPNPDAGDFTIVSSSPLATASTTGGIVGDPRWLKTVSQAVNLTVTASPAEGGTVSPASAVFEAGDEVTLSATANYGFRFKEWQDAEGKTVSTENPYTFAITADAALVGVFAAVDTYALTVNKGGEGAKWGKVALLPEPVGGIYETGTEVTASITSTPVTSFLGWEDGSAEPARVVTMDADKEIRADFDVIPFIVAWDFAVSEPRGNRPADYAFTTDNTGVLGIYNGDGSSTNWGGSVRNFGTGDVNCIRRYTGSADMSNPRSFVARFNTDGYTNIRIHSQAAADNNCVHSIQKMQYSTDGTTYTDLATIDLTDRKNTWVDFDAELPEGLGVVYIRWIGDTTSPLLGSPSATDTEGFYLANVVVYADAKAIDDTEAPVMLSSSPAEGSTSAMARGSFVLTFNERVVPGTGDITLNGQTLNGVFGSRTVTLAYKGLDYGTAYKLTVPAGAITDISGNAFAGVELNFTTMTRPVPQKRTFDAVVAKDGTGDFTAVQAAIDAAPEGRIAPYLIFVKNGEYEELVVIPDTKPFIHLIGQDKEKTCIKFWINNGGTSDKGYEYSTNNPASPAYGHQGVFQVNSTDFYTENITYYNSYGVETQNGPMGLAMRSCNDRQAFNNCKFRSYQDTWFTTTTNVSDRHYVNNCWIEGAVDYFYGAGDIYVENTTFYQARPGSVIVAPAHKPGTKYGYVIDRCTLDGVAGDGNKLGRAWQNEPQTVFLNTTFKASFAPEGWSEWHIAPALFAEYNSMDADGNPIDLTNRRTTYRVDGLDEPAVRKAVLTAEEAARYTYENVTSGDDGWNPRKFFEAVDAPAEAVKLPNGTIEWKPSDYAICYIVLDGEDNVLDITTDTSYTPKAMTDGDYYVKAVNEYGSLGTASKVDVSTGVKTVEPKMGSVARAYYNAQGVRTATATKGLNIVVETMSDGTCKAYKTMVK